MHEHAILVAASNYLLRFVILRNSLNNFQNKQEIPCTTEARSTFFGCTGSNTRFLGFFIFSMKFLFVQSSTIMLYVRNLGLLPDDDFYGPMLHWPPKALKLGFLSLFIINIKFLIDRVPSCPTFEIWYFGRIGE
jgi:hypothetical protein